MSTNGIVIKSTGSWYQVRTDDGDRVEARIRGKFRLDGMKLTNPVAVGDKVKLNFSNGDEALISEIMPRQNYVVRQSPRQKHNLHLMAANVDQAVLVITIISPDLKQGFIDRFLLMTEPHDIPVTIIFNKKDLWNDEAWELYHALHYIYTEIGYGVEAVSAIGNQDSQRILEELKDRTTLMAGQSGVGKTTLLNSLQPGLGLRTQELSEYTGKGQHTTTFAEMFELKEGGYIIDTPGIKTLSFNNLEPMDVAHNFREIFKASQDCKFHDCFHRGEPKCAVKKAVENGEISELRYLNYLQIMDEIEEQNYWERHSDL
jgi:ribosome biogenesis GTPase